MRRSREGGVAGTATATGRGSGIEAACSTAGAIGGGSGVKTGGGVMAVCSEASIAETTAVPFGPEPLVPIIGWGCVSARAMGDGAGVMAGVTTEAWSG